MGKRIGTMMLVCAGLAGAAALPAAQGDGQGATMKAVVLEDGKTSVRDMPRPQPGAGEVLVQVRAVSVNPINWKIASGYTGPPRAGKAPAAQPAGAPGGPPAAGGNGAGGPGGPGGPGGAAASGPRVFGSDISGTIVQLGSGVTGWKTGDAVLANSQAGYAEYAVVKADQLNAKPASLGFAEAAGIPLVAATVWNSIFDVAHLQRGQKILIHGATGGTGSAAVQLAKARGAYVIGTASAANLDFLRSLGADEVIDYNAVKFEERVRDVDVVFNTANLDTASRSIAIVKKGGYLMSIAGIPDPEACAAAQITCGVRAMQGATPAAEVVKQVLELVAAGKYRVNVDRSWPLADYQQAWDYSKQGHTRGKLVLLVGGT